MSAESGATLTAAHLNWRADASMLGEQDNEKNNGFFFDFSGECVRDFSFSNGYLNLNFISFRACRTFVPIEKKVR